MNEGGTPKNRLPMRVATVVARATVSTVRALTSTSISSTANRTPPMGVLKVAAMPAPAPAASRVTRCQGGSFIHWPRVDPKAAPIWAIGPSRPTAPPVPMDRAEASALITTTTGRMTPLS